jgi:hypothetical protein
MMEQARQSLFDEQDDEAIAQVAARASKRSRVFARLLGEADAIAAATDASVEQNYLSQKRKHFAPIWYSCGYPPYKVHKVSPYVSPQNSDEVEGGRLVGLLLENGKIQHIHSLEPL